MSTIEAVHVKAGMTLVHHESRQEFTVVQNAKVNQVIVVRDADGEIHNFRYTDYLQPVEIKDEP